MKYLIILFLCLCFNDAVSQKFDLFNLEQTKKLEWNYVNDSIGYAKPEEIRVWQRNGLNQIRYHEQSVENYSSFMVYKFLNQNVHEFTDKNLQLYDIYQEPKHQKVKELEGKWQYEIFWQESEYDVLSRYYDTQTMLVVVLYK